MPHMLGEMSAAYLWSGSFSAHAERAHAQLYSTGGMTVFLPVVGYALAEGLPED